MSQTTEDKLQATRACEAAETFANIYYETFDKRRNVVAKMYMETASLTWNGRNSTGPAAILTFLESLPMSEHTMDCLDAQPIIGTATQGETVVLVKTNGIVKFEGNDPRTFSQSFLLTTQGASWKIVTDNVRHST